MYVRVRYNIIMLWI